MKTVPSRSLVSSAGPLNRYSSATLPLLIVLLPLFASAADLESASTRHPEVHQAIVQGIAFSAKIDEAPEIITPQISAERDVVLMDKFEVKSHLLSRDLEAAIAKHHPPAHAHSHAKLGTGVYEADFGKVRAFSVNVLYVPVLVGISW